MNCCACFGDVNMEEWNYLAKDEKEEHNICKVCNAFLCSRCRTKYEETGVKLIMVYTCPCCRTEDWKKLFEEEILWWIRNSTDFKGFTEMRFNANF